MKSAFITFVILLVSIACNSQKIFSGENGKKGVKNKLGETVIETEYDFIKEVGLVMPLGISSRYNVVQRDPSKIYLIVTRDDKYGLFNYEGEEILPVTCNYIQPEMSVDSILTFRQEFGKWSFINLKNKKVVQTSYPSMEVFYEGMAAVKVEDQKLGFIDIRGELVIPTEYNFGKGFSEGVARVYKNDAYGYIDLSGKALTDFEFDHAEHFSHGVGIANKGGKWLENPMLFTGGKWGLVDQSGNNITAFEFDHIGAFIDDSLIFVNKGRYFDETIRRETGGKFAILNYRSGKEVSDYFRADEIGFADREEFPSILKIKINDKYGLINLDGNEITPLKYTYIGSLKEDGYFIARIGSERYKLAPNGEAIKIED